MIMKLWRSDYNVEKRNVWMNMIGDNDCYKQEKWWVIKFKVGKGYQEQEEKRKEMG